MKKTFCLFLLFGVVALLLFSCGKVRHEAESGKELQTNEEGKVLLSSLSDEDFVDFLESNGIYAFDREHIDAGAVDQVKEIVRDAERGYPFYASPHGGGTTEMDKAIFAAAQAYYGIANSDEVDT